MGLVTIVSLILPQTLRWSSIYLQWPYQNHTGLPITPLLSPCPLPLPPLPTASTLIHLHCKILLPETLSAQLNQQAGREFPHLEKRTERAGVHQLLQSQQTLSTFYLVNVCTLIQFKVSYHFIYPTLISFFYTIYQGTSHATKFWDR